MSLNPTAMITASFTGTVERIQPFHLAPLGQEDSGYFSNYYNTFPQI